MEFVKYGVGWILAIVAIGAGAYYFFFNKRNKKLELDASVTSLIATSVRGHADLEITLDGKTVADPYVLEFAATNVGHRDIGSKDFDADKPFQVKVGAEIIAPLLPADADDANDTFSIDESRQFLLINPIKLQVGKRHEGRFLTDGKPLLSTADNPLLDTDVVLGVDERLRQLGLSRRLNKLTTALMMCTLVILVPLATFDEQLGIRTGTWMVIPDAVLAPPWAVALFILGLTAAVLAFVLMPITQIHMRRTSRTLGRTRDASQRNRV